MKRVVVKIAYMGEGFSGSQIQPVGRTVESELLDKLTLITKLPPEELDLKLSSRTDKGVNALGNAIIFNSNFDDDMVLLKALNSVGKDIFFRSICEVEPEFNIRYATDRSYRYILPADGMDRELAMQCADIFIGEHDFARFCKPDNKPTVAKVDSIELLWKDDVVVIDFKARFFLWNQIRRMISAIQSVSKGVRTLDDVHKALDGLEEINFGVSRPDALTLLDVNYDWLEFREADSSQFSGRKQEEAFRSELRSTFYDSI